MTYMTENQYNSELAKIKKRNEGIKRRRKLHEERMRYWPKFVLPSTSKIVLVVSGILCLEILIFCQYMIIKTGDTNALYAMVGALFTFMAVVLGYFVKSTKENTVGGIKYDSVMSQIQTPTQDYTNEESVG